MTCFSGSAWRCVGAAAPAGLIVTSIGHSDTAWHTALIAGGAAFAVMLRRALTLR